MEALCAEAVYCTRGEERAATLLESVRLKIGVVEENKWLTSATSLCQRAIFELQTRAVEVDGLLEAGDTSSRPPYYCPPLETLEALDTHFTLLTSEEDKWPRFQEAVEKGESTLVDLLILAGVNPSGPESKPLTPMQRVMFVDQGKWTTNNAAIQCASHFGYLPIVNRLLQDERVDPSANDNEAIHRASKAGHLPIVNRLLQDARVDPSTAIIGASHFGHLPIVDRLLQDARVNPSVSDNAAIRGASQFGHLPVVNRLLQDERVDPSAQNNSAIRRASWNDHLPVVERLLQDARVDPSAGDNETIIWASRNGRLPIIDRLLQDVRVDPSAHNNDGIRLASYFSHLSVINRLLQDERVTSTLSNEDMEKYRTCLNKK